MNTYAHRLPWATGREGSPCLIFSLPVKFAEGAKIDDTQVSSPAERISCSYSAATQHVHQSQHPAVHCDTQRHLLHLQSAPPPPNTQELVRGDRQRDSRVRRELVGKVAPKRKASDRCVNQIKS